MPTPTATVRSAKTVREKVVSQTAMSVLERRRMDGDLAPLAHVVGDDEEDGGEGGERDEAGQGRGDEKDGEQGEGVDHAGDGGVRAGADVGGGAGDGAGGGDASEERGGDVGDALRDELHVGVVVIAAHAVGDDGGEEAFDGGEQGDGEGGGKQRENVTPRKLGRAKWGRPWGMPPNLVPMVSMGRWKSGDGGGGERAARRWSRECGG